MKTDFVIDISPPVPYLTKFWFASYVPKCSRPIRFQDSLKRNIPRKKGIMKLIFVIQINIEVFYRLILSFCVCIAGLAQSIQNKKFAYLCNISRNTWAMKLLFCLQINTKVLDKLIVSLWLYKARWPGMPKLPKITSLLFLCNTLRKKPVKKLIFCMQRSMKVSCKSILWFWWGWSSILEACKIASMQCLYNISNKKLRDKVVILHADKVEMPNKLISTIWTSKFPTGCYCHYWLALSSILRVLKVISLQYLYNISKKKSGMEFIFWMQINNKLLYKLAVSFLMKLASHI